MNRERLMSLPTSPIRRSDLAMSDEQARTLLRQGFSGQLATAGADQWPYVIPLLYVWKDERIFVHTSRAAGHFRASVEKNHRVCFLVNEPGTVYGYGRFQCDSSLSYRSVMAFGSLGEVDGPQHVAEFCDELMLKYGADEFNDRPRSVYPRLHDIAVYAIQVERLTGKEIQLPVAAARWPALDRTKSPHAQVR